MFCICCWYLAACMTIWHCSSLRLVLEAYCSYVSWFVITRVLHSGCFWSSFPSKCVQECHFQWKWKCKKRIAVVYPQQKFGSWRYIVKPKV
jgi:hypothetical protein